MLNRVILIGRLTKDPELRYTPNGKAVSNFIIAVDRLFKNSQGEKETDFINIVIWGPQAESCANYLKKGKLAAIDGRLQIRSYEPEGGPKKWIAEVVAENVRFLSPKDNLDPSGMGTNQDFNDDDIPF